MSNLVLERLSAADVMRFHTSATIKDKTIGQHSFNMMIIGDFIYYGNMPSELYQAIMYHDLHEAYTGDMPHPAKKNKPLRKALDKMEAKINKKMGIEVVLSDENKDMLRILDFFDVRFFAIQEKILGNDSLTNVFNESGECISRLLGKGTLRVPLLFRSEKLLRYSKDLWYTCRLTTG